MRYTIPPCIPFTYSTYSLTCTIVSVRLESESQVSPFCDERRGKVTSAPASGIQEQRTQREINKVCGTTEGRSVQRGIQEVDVQVGCGGITVTSEHGLELLEPRNVFPSPRPVLPVHTSEKVCFVLNVCSNLTARFSTPTGKMVFVLRPEGQEVGRQ